MTEAASSVRIILDGAIDYAGLFPPAKLDMSSAVRNHASYRAGEHAWALGRFIVPVDRLDELDTAARGLLPRAQSDRPWRISALLGSEIRNDVGKILEFNAQHSQPANGMAVIDAVEFKATTPDQIYHSLEAVPASITRHVEIPIDNDPAELVSAIAQSRGRAKVRTGGTTQDAFPTSHELARFIHACTNANVPFKATAGLHHPIRSTYPLTYDQGSPKGKMFGFLNVILAAALVRAGVSVQETQELLEEESMAALRFDGDGVRWRTRMIGTLALKDARTRIMLSFGSCSFTEPIDDLRKLNLL